MYKRDGKSQLFGGSSSSLWFPCWKDNDKLDGNVVQAGTSYVRIPSVKAYHQNRTFSRTQDGSKSRNTSLGWGLMEISRNPLFSK